MNFSTIQFYPGPRVASIVLNRPPLNVINLQMLDELDAAWSEVEDLKAQVAVISAAGDRAFVPGAILTETVDTYVDKLLTKSSAVLALTKRALREGAGRHFETALDRSQELYLRDLIRTEDMLEGMNAFLEKRPPAWKNR